MSYRISYKTCCLSWVRCYVDWLRDLAFPAIKIVLKVCISETELFLHSLNYPMLV